MRNHRYLWLIFGARNQCPSQISHSIILIFWLAFSRSHEWSGKIRQPLYKREEGIRDTYTHHAWHTAFNNRGAASAVPGFIREGSHQTYKCVIHNTCPLSFIFVPAAIGYENKAEGAFLFVYIPFCPLKSWKIAGMNIISMIYDPWSMMKIMIRFWLGEFGVWRFGRKPKHPNQNIQQLLITSE